jgi:hypothetical protein
MALDTANRATMETGTSKLADDAKKLRENEQVQKTYPGVDQRVTRIGKYG